MRSAARPAATMTTSARSLSQHVKQLIFRYARALLIGVGATPAAGFAGAVLLFGAAFITLKDFTLIVVPFFIYLGVVFGSWHAAPVTLGILPVLAAVGLMRAGAWSGVSLAGRGRRLRCVPYGCHRTGNHGGHGPAGLVGAVGRRSGKLDEWLGVSAGAPVDRAGTSADATTALNRSQLASGLIQLYRKFVCFVPDFSAVRRAWWTARQR